MQTRHGSIVVVSNDDHNRAALRRIFGENGWQIHVSRGISEFRRSLKPRWSGVVLTETRLPDGTWHDVLSLANTVCPSAQIVVTSRHADEHLWAEVLNCGGFDLLAQPLDRTEVIRVGTSAWLHAQPKAFIATA